MPDLEPEPAEDYTGEGLYPEGHVEDALDAQDREDAQAAAARAADLAKRSTALQRELPRPMIVNRDEMLAPAAGADAAALDASPHARAADQMVREEMVGMLEADAASYPVPGAPEATGRKRKPLKPLAPEAAAAAAALVEAEAQAMRGGEPPPAGASLGAACAAAAAELAYVPSLQRYAPLSSVTRQEAVQAPQQQLQLLKNFMARDAKRAGKAEKKLEVLLGGYKKRASALSKDLERRHDSILEKRVELECFRVLQHREALAGPQREEQLAAMLASQEAREDELQSRYAELLRTRETLLQQTRARAAQS